MTAKIAPLNSITCSTIVGGLSVIKASSDDDDNRTAIVPSLASRRASQCFLEGMRVTNGVASCFHRRILTTLCSNEIVGARHSSLLLGDGYVNELEHCNIQSENASVYWDLLRLVCLRRMAHLGVCAGASKAKTLHSLRNP